MSENLNLLYFFQVFCALDFWINFLATKDNWYDKEAQILQNRAEFLSFTLS